jgi:hypothetical protein
MSSKIKWDIIGPEIKNDDFYNLLVGIISGGNGIKTILEIGASSGDGSTEALMIGKNRSNNKDIQLFSIEVCTERFDRLKERYAEDPNFFPYNVSSVPLSSFPDFNEVAHFMTHYKTSSLAPWPIQTVKEWYDKDKEYIATNNIYQNGIELIKQKHSIQHFDCVLIDGSEFTGKPELDLVYGAKFILLDDIRAYKNWCNHNRLRADPMYNLLLENNLVRNGFSLFVRI